MSHIERKTIQLQFKSKFPIKVQVENAEKLGMTLGRIIGIVMVFVLLTGAAPAVTSNRNVVYQGRILRPGGDPVNSGTINFTLKVYSPPPSSCLLYSETQSLNMTGSVGTFSLNLGEGTAIDGVAQANLATIWTNAGTLSGLTCVSGSSYTPSASDDRQLVVSFTDAGVPVTLAPLSIRAVPYALQAEQLSGYGIMNVAKISGAGSANSMTGTQFDFLTNLAAPAGVSATPCAAGEILKYTGAAWACSADATGGAMGDATYLVKGVVQLNTDAATSGLTIAGGILTINSGVGANQILKLDGTAKIPAVDGSQLTNLNAANLSGAVPPTKGGTGLSALGTANQVLGVDAAGLASEYKTVTAGAGITVTHAANSITIAATGSGTVTNVTGTAPIISSGGATPAISLDTGLGANKIPQVGGTALGANGVVVANAGGTALTSLNCAINQVIKFDVSGFAQCGTDVSGAALSGITAASAANSINNAAFAQTWNWQMTADTTAFNITENAASTGGTGAQDLLKVNTLAGSTANPLHVKAGANEALFVDTSGNVGIGTTAPSNKLTLNGSFNMIGSLGVNAQFPGYSLEVNDTGSGAAYNPTVAPSVQARFKNTSVLASNYGGISVGARPAVGNPSYAYFGNVTTGDGNGDLVIGTTAAAAYQERMRITSAGNVGIGSTAPAAKLEIDGASGSTLKIVDGNQGAGKVLTSDGAGQASWQAPAGGGSSALSGATGATAANTIDNSNFAQAWNWSTATTENPMSLSANALTTGSLLSVTSSSASLNSTNGLLNVANTSASTTGTVARIQANSTAGSGLTVLANGNVGIGTSAPTGKFHSVETGVKTAANYSGYFENTSTNATTDSINKYGIYVTSTGGFAGSTGVSTYNYGLYVDTVSGADKNLGAYFVSPVGMNDSNISSEQLRVKKTQSIASQGIGSNSIAEMNHTSGNPTGYGAVGQAWNINSGNASVIGGVKGYAEQDGSGTVADLAALYASANSRNSGTVTRNSGLYIEDQSSVGTSNFQIYSVGNVPSYFAGNIGIGTTTPAQPLEVAGNVNVGSQTTRTLTAKRGQLAQGSTYITTANASTTIDWNNGNIQELSTYLCDGVKTITMSSLRDGAAYSLLISGGAAHSGTCGFTAGGYTFKTSGGASTPTSSRDVLFTFVVINNIVVYNMTDNLQ